MSLLGHLLQFFGIEFLTATQLKQFGRINDSKKRAAFLMKHAAPKLLPLWYFTVSLCRLLMQGENRLTPQDAYYLGIVDEVIGTDLIGIRSVAEEVEKKEAAKKAAAAKSNDKKPSQPASTLTSAP
jgi:hypothetical protein